MTNPISIRNTGAPPMSSIHTTLARELGLTAAQVAAVIALVD